MKAVLFDLIGTTVKEKDPDVITRCFSRAFADNGITIDIASVTKQRGTNKKEAIAKILTAQQLPVTIAASIYSSFQSNIENNIDSFYENDDASHLFEYLHLKKIKIGLGSGLSRDLFEKIFTQMKWNKDDFDFIGIGDEYERGRPHPDMIIAMMTTLSIDKNEFLKVGDTVADILEGKNAGVHTAVILSGTQSEEELTAQNPDFILHSLADLKKIIV